LYIFLFSVFVFCGSGYAQKDSSSMHFSIFGGAAFPLSDFSSITQNDAGFARTGYCGMIEADKNIINNVYWASSISFAYNNFARYSFRVLPVITWRN
jgi:hypothetical protein